MACACADWCARCTAGEDFKWSLFWGEVDEDGNGKITIDEFTHMAVQVSEAQGKCSTAAVDASPGGGAPASDEAEALPQSDDSDDGPPPLEEVDIEEEPEQRGEQGTEATAADKAAPPVPAGAPAEAATPTIAKGERVPEENIWISASEGTLEDVEQWVTVGQTPPLATENRLENTDGVLRGREREGGRGVGAPHQCSLGAAPCYFYLC